MVINVNELTVESAGWHLSGTAYGLICADRREACAVTPSAPALIGLGTRSVFNYTPLHHTTARWLHVGWKLLETNIQTTECINTQWFVLLGEFKCCKDTFSHQSTFI